MKSITNYAIGALSLAFTAGLFWFAFSPYFIKPCTDPITYSIGSIDDRFNLSEAELLDALSDAESLWDDVLPAELFSYDPNGEVKVHLQYSELQRATELGKTIDSDQMAYNAKKAEIESLKQSFNQAKATYQSLLSRFNTKNKKYASDVEYWNNRGGAPKEEYEELQQTGRELAEEQEELNAQVDKVNQIAASINDEVDEFNVLARKINAKVANYNSSINTEDEQGDYVSDREGKRIHVFEYSSGTDLRRVLAHEFGHALGIDHTENPESIMYSYNLGDTFALSEEDRGALKAVCKVQ